jgi:hypothetical protein
MQTVVMQIKVEDYQELLDLLASSDSVIDFEFIESYEEEEG